MSHLIRPTRSHEQRPDVVRVEEPDQVIERAEEPAARVCVHPHQLIHMLETFFCALHLRHKYNIRFTIRLTHMQVG